MSERQSLAEEAVEALAAVSRMAMNVDNTHPERHTIRTLKRHAEQILQNAVRQARDLAFLAEDIQREARKQEQQSNG